MKHKQQPTTRLQPPASSLPFVLLIFAKYPEPGKVKTRLAAHLGAIAAASLYQRFVGSILALGKQCSARQVFVAISPDERIADFCTLFPGDYHAIPQIDSLDLGERIIAAARQVFAYGCSKLLIIGTDSPNLPSDYLEKAFLALDSHDIVIGPAEDGGYYLIGLQELHTKLFEDIAWSTSEVLAQTLERCRSLELRVHLLPSWYDVDDLPTYQRLIRDNPEFAEFSH